VLRIRTVLWAVLLLVVAVFAAASVAAAMPSTTEHSQDAKLDKLHAVRPIAAFTDPSAPQFAGEVVLTTAVDPPPLPPDPAPAASSAVVTAGSNGQRIVAEALSAQPIAAPDVVTALACIRWRESHDDYAAVSRDGLYHGAYQFLQSTWDSTARAADRPDLIGRDPAIVSPADQDAMAVALYEMQGARPWGGFTC
jgi:hypothetical protein